MSNAAMPVPTGIFETHLSVSELDRSIAFYRDMLGLELAHHLPARNVAFFWVGGRKNGMLGLWQTGTGPMRMRLHFAFKTILADVLAAPARMRAKGLQPLGFNGEPVDQAVVLGWMPAASIYCVDPDGHSLEYIAVLDQAPDQAFGVAPWSDWIARNAD